MAGEKFVRTMRNVAKGANPPSSKTDVLFGTVTSENPLKINIENRFEVGASLLILSPFCYDMEFQGTKLWERLKKGDKVNLLRCQQGQKFYVLDKGRV